MINLKLFRENPNLKDLIKLKDPNFDVDSMINLYNESISLKINLDNLLNQSNEIAKSGKSGKITDEIKEKARTLNYEISNIKLKYEEIENKLNYLYLRCPNIIDPSIPKGGKEKNLIIKTEGEKPNFEFNPLNHVELLELEEKKQIDFSIGAKITRAGFPFYRNKAAKILYKLCDIFLKHNESKGFEIIIPSHLISKEAITAASNLPKFEEDVFCTKDNLYLIPTAEVSLTYIHSNEILNEEELPIRYTAWSNCFRAEAGGYGSNERGLIRINEFEKVELVSFCKQEESSNEHEKMLICAEELLKKLKLHYRVSLLSSEDCSFASSKTYDIEIWLPGQSQYKEVSSISNCTDFQSRRSKTRYKNKNTNDIKLVHTLNASSLAIPRVLVALLETYQTNDKKIDYDKIIKLLDSI